jgi:hypothetical protein
MQQIKFDAPPPPQNEVRFDDLSERDLNYKFIAATFYKDIYVLVYEYVESSPYLIDNNGFIFRQYNCTSFGHSGWHGSKREAIEAANKLSGTNIYVFNSMREFVEYLPKLSK